MKKMRRFAAIAAAAAMTACMAVPMMSMMTASASEYVITVENNITGMTNTEYVAYKILNVSYDAGKTAYTYSVPTENPLLTESEILAQNYSGTGAFTKMDDLYTWLNDATNKDKNARTFADALYKAYPNTFVKGNGVSGTDSIDTGSTGYYLVTGTVTDSNNNAIVSSVILTTMDPTAKISPKLDAPTHNKEIQHNDDNSWDAVGDNQIGDTVNYRITTTMPDPTYVAAFNGSYVYTIHDEMTKGLDFDANSVKVMLGTQELEANTHYTVENSCDHVDVTRKDGQTDGESFEVVFNLDKIIEDYSNLAVDGAEFVTSYSCTLTTEALVAGTAADDKNSNDNTSHLEYSNNPYVTSSTANTADVTVYDWTFTFDVTKYKNEATAGNELAGAGFKLYEGSTELKFTKLDGEVYAVDPNGTVTEITTTADGTFKIVGLDDATEYKLVENTVPSGYNKAEDVKFTISDTYEGTPAGAEIATLKSNMADEELNVDVINKSGASLPSTGGIGTTLFYVIGGTLAAGAGVSLIAKKRMKNED